VQNPLSIFTACVHSLSEFGFHGLQELNVRPRIHAAYAPPVTGQAKIGVTTRRIDHSHSDIDELLFHRVRHVAEQKELALSQVVSHQQSARHAELMFITSRCMPGRSGKEHQMILEFSSEAQHLRFINFDQLSSPGGCSMAAFPELTSLASWETAICWTYEMHRSVPALATDA
jgi:hypothetical protein